MVFTSRAVRLALPPEGGYQPASDPDDGTSDGVSLHHIVGHQRQQQVMLFQEETGRLRRTRADLLHLSRLRETLEVRHPPPWSPELTGWEKLLTNEEAWREYEWRYLRVAPSVQLPPPEEVNINLLTARLLGEQPMLPTPGRTCAQGFFPPQGRGRLGFNEPRLRCLVPGAQLPNTVIIRLLWSTRTLLDVEYYRAMENRRTRRRQHWEYFEWSDSELEEEEDDEEEAPQGPTVYMSRLEGVATRRRNRRKVSMVDHHHLENWLQLAASGVDDGAAPDSEDEVIARLRQRRISRRGKLLSDIDGMPATEEDAYTPALGRYTCGWRSREKKQRKKKPRGDASDKVRHTRRRRRGNDEGATGSGTTSRETLYSDDEYWGDGDDDEPTGDLDNAEQTKIDHTGTGESGLGAAGGGRASHRPAAGPHVQTGFGVSPATSAADGHVTGVPGPQLSPRFAAGDQACAAGATSPARWSGQADQSPNRLQARGQPPRRAGSVSPGRGRQERASVAPGGDKTLLNTSRVRPDMDAAIGSAVSDRTPPRRQALKMPHLFEVKDYVCEESKVPGKGPTENGMKYHDVKHVVGMRKGKFVRKSEGGPDSELCLPKAQKWSSSRIPGIFYDVCSDDECEGDAEESTVSDALGGDKASSPRRAGSRGWKPRSALGTGPMRQVAIDYVKSLMQHEWAQELLHGSSQDSLDPWEAAERLARRLPKQPFEIQQDILHELRTIHETFPAPENLRPISTGILAGLSAATDDIVTFSMSMDTLVLLDDQMDVVLANVLTLLTIDRLDVRDCIQTLLERMGLVDPHHVLLAEVLSWGPRGKHKNHEAHLKEIGRKALRFVGNWMQAFEAHTKLIAEEVNKRKMDAIVKYNIIKILKNFEPLTIEESENGFDVNLREPSNASRLKNPEVIEALNYFVEMTDDEDELRQTRNESGHLGGRLPPTSDPLDWRRNNKDILVPSSASPVVQGYRPLVSGVLQPTSLVTHWHGVPGLAPGPWPTVTVGIRLRIADKYYRGTPPTGAVTEFQ